MIRGYGIDFLKERKLKQLESWMEKWMRVTHDVGMPAQSDCQAQFDELAVIKHDAVVQAQWYSDFPPLDPQGQRALIGPIVALFWLRSMASAKNKTVDTNHHLTLFSHNIIRHSHWSGL
jgi:hypothetical protein